MGLCLLRFLLGLFMRHPRGLSAFLFGPAAKASGSKTAASGSQLTIDESLNKKKLADAARVAVRVST